MPKQNIPSYRLHKSSGQAVVTLRGKMFYLGTYKSKTSREKYNEIISDFLANNCKLPPTRSQNEITVEELSVKFLEWAEGYYVAPGGKQTPTFTHCQLALKPFIQYYGKNCVSAFGPLSLVFIRDKWVDQGLGRETINRWCAVIKKAVKWSVAHELVVPEIFGEQKDKDGGFVLIQPSLVLVPPALGATAKTLHTSTTVNETTATGKPSPVDNPWG